MSEAFAQLQLSPTPQKSIGPFIVDFAFESHRLAVECDGVYWHNRPEQKKKDTNKDKYLRGHGWEVVRFSELDINRSPAMCAEIVRELLLAAIGGETFPTEQNG